MTEEQALRRAICEQPEDIGLRLIYADWLDEHGRSKEAGWVRLPLLPDMLPPSSRIHRERRAWIRPTVADLFPKTARFQLDFSPDMAVGLSLTDAVRDARWFVKPTDVALIVRYGFVSEVGCTARWWLRAGPALCQRHPIRDVRLFYQHPEDGFFHQRLKVNVPGYVWRRAASTLGVRSRIPSVLFDLLDGERQGGGSLGRIVRYPDVMTAFWGLSRACVAYGRTSGREP